MNIDEKKQKSYLKSSHEHEDHLRVGRPPMLSKQHDEEEKKEEKCHNNMQKIISYSYDSRPSHNISFE
jgi:hypothetical protein